MSLRVHMSDRLVNRSVLCGSYYLLTDGYVPLGLCREIVSLCIRHWSGVYTRSARPLWSLCKNPPTWLIKVMRPGAKFPNLARSVVKDLFEVEPRKALELLGSLSGDSEAMLEKAIRFQQNIFEALSVSDGSSGEYSETEYDSEGEGYPSSDMEYQY